MMHQPVTHLWKEGMHLWQGWWIGQIVALCGPGVYIVRDRYGAGCIGHEDTWHRSGVEVNYDYPDY